LETIGAFVPTSPPPNPLSLSFVENKNSSNEVNNEEEMVKYIGNKDV